MTERYRYGGPIPERAKQLAARRAYRSSEFFTNLKRRRGKAFDEARSAASGLSPDRPRPAPDCPQLPGPRG